MSFCTSNYLKQDSSYSKSQTEYIISANIAPVYNLKHNTSFSTNTSAISISFVIVNSCYPTIMKPRQQHRLSKHIILVHYISSYLESKRKKRSDCDHLGIIMEDKNNPSQIGVGQTNQSEVISTQGVPHLFDKNIDRYMYPISWTLFGYEDMIRFYSYTELYKGNRELPCGNNP